MNWNELSIYEKANLMKLYVANGITDLNTIKEHYNSFQDGGDTKKPRGYKMSSAIEFQDMMEANSRQNGGSLGKVTPYGQWQYPHQVTTIPSNNITMKGVNYPVIGVSNTGDTKMMFPNLDYTFNGNYVTEYPMN